MVQQRPAASWAKSLDGRFSATVLFNQVWATNACASRTQSLRAHTQSPSGAVNRCTEAPSCLDQTQVCCKALSLLSRAPSTKQSMSCHLETGAHVKQLHKHRVLRCADDAEMDTEVALGSVRADASELADVDESPGGVCFKVHFLLNTCLLLLSTSVSGCKWSATVPAACPSAYSDP